MIYNGVLEKGEEFKVKNERYSLISSLCDMITTASPESPEYKISEYFLRHYSELDQLNIYDVADACFVSRSSIRRFCQSIGFDNFKDLKEQFPQYDDMEGMHMLETADFYRKPTHLEIIGDVLSSLNARMQLPDTDELLKYINDSSSVMFYCIGFAENIAKEFQHEMIHCRKVIYVSSSLSFVKNWVSMATPDDLLVTISTSGSFADLMVKELGYAPMKKALLIASNMPDLDGEFDIPYHMASNLKDPPLDIYARYGLTYFFDMLFYRYESTYRTNDEGAL
jgi:hypothetical protein